MISNRFCPHCGKPLELLAGNLYSCWECGIPYNLIDGNLIVVDFEAEDEADGYVPDDEELDDYEVNEEETIPQPSSLSKEASNPLPLRQVPPHNTGNNVQPQRQNTSSNSGNYRQPQGQNVQKPVAENQPAHNTENNVQPQRQNASPNLGYYPQSQRQAVQNPVAENQPEPNNKFSRKSNAMLRRMVIWLFVCIAIAAALIIVSFATKLTVAPFLMITCGIVLLIIGIIMCAVIPKKARKLCPSCDNKREHHRRWVNTTQKREKINQTDYKIVITHHYIDTYICPNCGEKGEFKVTGSGGHISYSHQYGKTDNHYDPHEF